MAKIKKKRIINVWLLLIFIILNFRNIGRSKFWPTLQSYSKLQSAASFPNFPFQRQLENKLSHLSLSLNVTDVQNSIFS